MVIDEKNFIWFGNLKAYKKGSNSLEPQIRYFMMWSQNRLISFYLFFYTQNSEQGICYHSKFHKIQMYSTISTNHVNLFLNGCLNYNRFHRKYTFIFISQFWFHKSRVEGYYLLFYLVFNEDCSTTDLETKN